MMMVHVGGWALVRSGQEDTVMIFGYHIHIIFGKHSLRHNLGIDTTVWKAAWKRGVVSCERGNLVLGPAGVATEQPGGAS